jgi:hypothetical protein
VTWGDAGYCKGPIYDVVDEKGNVTYLSKWTRPRNVVADIEKKTGLYFLFVSFNRRQDVNNDKKQDQIYPYYVGITGQYFTQRFNEHRTNPGGVLKELKSKLVIVAYFVIMPLPVAKLYESLFLSLFDFPRNVEENGGSRVEVDIETPESVSKGITHFKKGYNRIKKYFKDVETMILNNEIG